MCLTYDVNLFAGWVVSSKLRLAASHSDLLVGRVRQPVLPYPEAEVKPAHAIMYSLDGLLDELTIYSQGLTA